MGVFMGLIVPLPFSVRRKLFAFVSESPVIAKLQYGLRVGHVAQKQISGTDNVSDHVHLHSHPVH